MDVDCPTTVTVGQSKSKATHECCVVCEKAGLCCVVRRFPAPCDNAVGSMFGCYILCYIVFLSLICSMITVGWIKVVRT